MASLLAADLAALGETPITIRSTFFPNVRIRVDGSGVTSTQSGGGGWVNAQYGPAGPYEKVKARVQPDGTVAFESAEFPKVYMRVDGTGLTANQAQGGGLVNCQFNVGNTEKFRVRDQADGSVAFESVAFPNVWLRLDATGVTAFNGNGVGTVNCQFGGAGAYEKFSLEMLDQRLAFNMQRQVQNQWCWSATTVSIAAYHDAASQWTQCSLVNAEFQRNDCCNNGSSANCNKPWWLEAPMTRTGHFAQTVNGALTPAQVGAEMVKSCPIAVATMWAGGGGHAIVVKGRYLVNGTEWVTIADPWDGDFEVTYDDFRNRYKGSGTWSSSYKSKP